jgi:putative ABC transport system permease protein
MISLLPYILKTLWRHRSRTVLTLSGSAIALFVLCFVAAIQQGMNNLQIQQTSRKALVVFQANKFCPATSHLPQDYDHQIAQFNGIREVVPIQVYTNNCRASLDVIVFYGVPAEKLRRVRDFELQQGDWSEFEDNQDSVVMGRSVAQRRGITSGDTFSLGGINVKIAGIYRSDDPAEEHYIYSHLDFLQRTRGFNQVGTVTQLEVHLKPDTDPLQACQTIDNHFRDGPTATDTRPKGVFQAKSLGDLTQLINMTRYLGYGCVGLVLSLLTTTTLMSVHDRIKEHAVLQTIGFSSGRVFGLVITETILLSSIGGMIGVGLAMIILTVSNLGLAAQAITIAFTPSLDIVISGLLISFISGAVAGVAPAIFAGRVEIVPALRLP